jgi:iron(III) transport system substrate-binding protein
MRHILFAFALILTAPAVTAFEVEEERIWGDPASALRLDVLSTTDIDIVAPVIDAFLADRPEIALRYVMASSQEIYRAIADEGAQFDLVLSSAMDLQMKLANDGWAAPYASASSARLPDWARWRDRLFGYTLEPVVLLVSRAGLGDLPVPRSRRALLELMRDHPDRFDSRVGTYDPRLSGVGYLFATQDARQTETFWRMAEVMGRLNTRLYCCSVDMIDDLESGALAIAYNVVGSYAATRLTGHPDILMVEPEDYTIALLRTALIPTTAQRPDLGAALLDFLLGDTAQTLMGPIPTVTPRARSALPPHMRPIRLDTGLLVHLDRIKRTGFLREWDGAMVQP